MTNAFEGINFVNQSFGLNGTLQDYVQNLFPTLSSSQAAQVAEHYTDIDLDGIYNQAVGVMGECKCAMHNLDHAELIFQI